ncbi:very short patch repair endonuclease [Pseudomonas sp. NPDC088444]|uniref:very short patch repair endonuclease n=1 Tax=Pseudomonas sp. NPDC088444 TaxID=3364456 RepID=UPI00384FB05C
MVDIVDMATRSRMMSGIKGKNTSPEVLIRKALHARGFRFRIHVSDLPGKPDLVLAKYRALIFVHGCFWHGHNCKYFKMPQTRAEFWTEKISKNQTRDERNVSKLLVDGWRILIIWECAVRDMKKKNTNLIEKVIEWLLHGSIYYEIDANIV